MPHKKEKNKNNTIVHSAQKGYDNKKFIHSSDGRVIRLLAEYLHPKQQLERMKVKKSIIFFGSARSHSSEFNPDSKSSKFYDEARRTAYLFAEWSKTLPVEKQFHICTGGGPGIMEAANRGAKEAGTSTIGLNISLPFEQYPNQYITPELNFEFHYFFMRKFWFVYLASAIIAFPGGLGTLDELMEILTLRQTEKVTKPLPILLYSKEYWKKVINFDYLIEMGMIKAEDMNLFKFVETPEEAFEYLKSELSRIHKIE
ncbi:MAG: TIGR00730 family Rossman fold protein [Bacteroidota bacterium]